jgi:hypothetical protein
MIRRIICAILLFIVVGLHAMAGNWIIHATFAPERLQNVIDTKNKVYYLASNTLYCFDKATQENAVYDKGNYLNDAGVTGIYLNESKGYVLVAYANSNIDIITQEGKIINLPDIKQSSIAGDKGINDVTFAAGKACLATDFGYVVINDRKWEVMESHNFGRKIVSAAIVGGYVFLSQGNLIYYGLESRHYDSLDGYKQWAINDNGRLYPVSDNSFMMLTGFTYRVAFEPRGGDELESHIYEVGQFGTTGFQKTKGGYLGNVVGKGFYYTVDEEVANLKKTPCDNGREIFSCSARGDGTMWSLNENGLHSDKSSAYYKPNAHTIEQPFYLTYNERDHLLYVSSTGTNKQVAKENYSTAINTYDGKTWTDVTPQPQVPNGGTYFPVFSPNEENTYFLSGWWQGFYKVANGKIVAHYDWTNTPLQWIREYYAHAKLTFDRAGNLWAIQQERPIGESVFVLPKAKQLSNTPSRSDWVNVNVPNLVGGKGAMLRFLKHSNMNVFANGQFEEALIFFAMGESPTSGIESRSYVPSTLIDQDGGKYSWKNITVLEEDLGGTVWMGTDQGVVSFDPRKALQNDFRINHIKVPRNDGTNLADYLLDAIWVNCIAVDAANRKWIGTKNAGLFLVSADGSEVLQHFTTGNTPMFSNEVYQVLCMPNTNSVFITQPGGLIEYRSNSNPAQRNYSAVYAYPNPVTPDYGGAVTITGLIDNSLVKIADNAGNVIKQYKSSGGAVSWDARNDEGERVPSGVYFIIASQGDVNGTESVVSKVLIMR